MTAPRGGHIIFLHNLFLYFIVVKLKKSKWFGKFMRKGPNVDTSNSTYNLAVGSDEASFRHICNFANHADCEFKFLRAGVDSGAKVIRGQSKNSLQVITEALPIVLTIY